MLKKNSKKVYKVSDTLFYMHVITKYLLLLGLINSNLLTIITYLL